METNTPTPSPAGKVHVACVAEAANKGQMMVPSLMVGVVQATLLEPKFRPVSVRAVLPLVSAVAGVMVEMVGAV